MSRPLIRGRFRLAWRSSIMPAPSFWYFASESDAIDAAAGLASLDEWSIGRWNQPAHIFGIA